MWCEWLSVSLCVLALQQTTNHPGWKAAFHLALLQPWILYMEENGYGAKSITNVSLNCRCSWSLWCMNWSPSLSFRFSPLALVWYSPSAFISCSPVHILHSPREFLCCHLLKLLLTYSTCVCLCVKYLIYPQQRSSPFVCCITFNKLCSLLLLLHASFFQFF